MRVVIIGASTSATITAQVLIERGHDVVLVETDRERIDALSDELDCGFLHGDGSNPSILREAGPEQTDLLFCITDHDQVNILASLMGRSLGFRRIITVIENQQLQSLCLELGLEETLVPVEMFSRRLVDMVEGVDSTDLSSAVKGDARVFMFVASGDDEGPVKDLGLPNAAKVICRYRDGEFHLADSDTSIRKGDEVVVLAHSKALAQLRRHWDPNEADARGAAPQTPDE